MTFAFVFPGQGSQSVGMLNSLATRTEVHATLQEASDALGENIGKLIAVPAHGNESREPRL